MPPLSAIAAADAFDDVEVVNFKLLLASLEKIGFGVWEGLGANF